MAPAQSGTLSPKRATAVTHGHCVVDQYGISFKYHTFLNPISVHAAMLRLKLCDWLVKYEYIVCETTEIMWELRKKLPGMSDQICIYTDLGLVYGHKGKMLIVGSGRKTGAWKYGEFQFDADYICSNLLWDITEITCSYA